MPSGVERGQEMKTPWKMKWNHLKWIKSLFVYIIILPKQFHKLKLTFKFSLFPRPTLIHWNNWQLHGNKFHFKCSIPSQSLRKIGLIKDPFDHPGRTGWWWVTARWGGPSEPWQLLLCMIWNEPSTTLRLLWLECWAIAYSLGLIHVREEDNFRDRRAVIFPSSSNFPCNAVCHYNFGTPLSTSAKWEKSLILDYSEKSVKLSRDSSSPR